MLVAVLVAAQALAAASPAGAAGRRARLEPVAATCGMVVTRSVALTGDLTCDGPGLVVDADNVTIDLRGHTLVGSGTDTGIAATGRRGLKVRAGSIEGFARAILLEGTTAARIDRVAFRNNRQFSVFESAASGTVVSRSEVTDGGGDIGAVSSVGTTIESTNLDGASARFAGGTGHHIEGSHFSGGGIWFNQSDGSVVHDNEFLGGDTGVSVFQGRNHEIRDNEITGYRVGVVIADAASAGNRVVGNRLESNLVGLVVGSPESGFVVADGTVVHANRFRSNGAAGLLVAARFGSLAGSQVTENIFAENGWAPGGTTNGNGEEVDDGLHVAIPADMGDVVVAGNVAYRNADLGIEASVVVDGGGNRASQNGNTAQCEGVTCTAGRG